MSTPEPSTDDVAAGAAAYTPGLLRIYDTVVLSFSARVLWRCRTERVLALYDRHAGARHVDVGVGTGYLLDRCAWPVAAPQITLVDLSATALAYAARRVERYEPRTVQASVLDDVPLPAAAYDSVGCAYLLHCVPGGMQRKAAALGRLGRLLVPGGTLFGATILGTADRHTPWSRAVNALYNRKRIFANAGDDVDTLRQGLEADFDSCELEVVGAVALFAAQRTRTGGPASPA
ncbi:MAG: class I SAM-dependent methyltransferase [Solirubrobacteraceae bacterium]